ncbi:MAG: FG-GAP-like repeat-containing protein, partial [Candidatus Latescibacteria bacterium]|nr:FG-GAP-like repeat-containing protein [Candidatus Latescibacterota bacterium]
MRAFALCCGLAAWALAGGTGWAQPTLNSVTPVANSHTAAPTTAIIPVFSTNMSAATTATFAVHGEMTGKRTGAYSGGGTATITFAPTAQFKPGELVQVTFTGGVTAGYTNTANTPIGSGGFVYRFRAAAGAGPVNLTGRRHIGPGTGGETKALGAADVDNDGDVDLVTVDNGGQNTTYKQHKGEFSIASNFGTGTDQTHGLALGDLDGDGFIDVALAQYVLSNAAYLNDGAGNFTG